MAHPGHLRILQQGVDAWNKWRVDNPEINPSLDEANLSDANIQNINLSKVNLQSAYLKNAILRNANLQEIDLRGIISPDACDGPQVPRDWGAKLTGADLRGADLRGALLQGAYFNDANLTGVMLENTRLDGVIFGNTIFADLDFSKVNGLELASHLAPSIINTGTIQLSLGKIPEAFLRGCGLSDLDIEYAKLYNPDLSNQEIIDITYKIHDLRANQSVQISPLFISYSHTDSKFVEAIENQLDQLGVRYWRDVRDATAGPLEKQVDRAISLNPTVLLVLSKNSIKSDWVEHEVRTARELTKELGRHVLCPVALDDSWKSSPWPKRVMEQVMEYNILDFSKWKDESVFEKQFRKLLDGLDLFYK
jgi:hypothetical protein